MVACSVMSYFDRTIMSIAGPEIMKEFALSTTQMGSVYSAFILSYAILMIPGGHVADRLGPRLTLLLMNLSAALFTGLTAFGGQPGLGSVVGVWPALIAIRLGLGVGTAPLYPACARMSANWIPIAHQGRGAGTDYRRRVAGRRGVPAVVLLAHQALSVADVLPHRGGCNRRARLSCGFGLSAIILPVFIRRSTVPSSRPPPRGAGCSPTAISCC